ncbi:MAG: sensor histidine kinase [Spirochaetes bacterium]|nr:sensor histidine kinase [Spirochaetota bacterium]MBU1080094.1 sensor histidine kinase [Spirochaetota bacterium]
MGRNVRTAFFVAVLFLVIGTVDFVTTSSIKVTVLYFLPLFIAAYYYSTMAGALVSIASACVNLLVGYLEIGRVSGVSVANGVVLLGSCLVIVQFVRAIKKKDAAIRRNLAEKETIIRDIHHRMKNQMSSLLSLVRLSDGGGQLLSEVESRIHAYYALYDSLCYRSDSQTRIHFGDYVRRLCDNVIKSMRNESVSVDLSVRGFDFEYDHRYAINVGLVLNELVTNSMKYAFVSRSSGRIEIEGAIDTCGALSIAYFDDGPGFEYAAEPVPPSMGMIIVRSLVAQMNGSLAYDNERGSRYSFVFPAIEAAH